MYATNNNCLFSSFNIDWHSFFLFSLSLSHFSYLFLTKLTPQNSQNWPSKLTNWPPKSQKTLQNLKKPCKIPNKLAKSQKTLQNLKKPGKISKTLQNIRNRQTFWPWRPLRPGPTASPEHHPSSNATFRWKDENNRNFFYPWTLPLTPVPPIFRLSSAHRVVRPPFWIEILFKIWLWPPPLRSTRPRARSPLYVLAGGWPTRPLWLGEPEPEVRPPGSDDDPEQFRPLILVRVGVERGRRFLELYPMVSLLLLIKKIFRCRKVKSTLWIHKSVEQWSVQHLSYLGSSWESTWKFFVYFSFNWNLASPLFKANTAPNPHYIVRCASVLAWC